MKKFLKEAAVFLGWAVFFISAGNAGYLAFGASVSQMGQAEKLEADRAGETVFWLEDGQEEENPGNLEGSTDKPNGEEENIADWPGHKAEADGDGPQEAEDSLKKPEDEEWKEARELGKPVLYAASKPDGGIKLSWKRTEGAVWYVLYRSTNKDGGYRKIYEAEEKPHSRYYIDQGRTAGKIYYYQLAAFSKGQEERRNSRIVAGRFLNQAELTGVSNLSGSRKLVLHWKHVKGAAKYQIQRKSGSGEYKVIASVKGSQNTYTDKQRYGGKIYSYRVCAKDARGGRGNYSRALGQMAIDKDRKMIALTYDDGPSEYTPIVLDAIKKHGVHATFFVVGNRVNYFSESIRQEAALGCEIGNHTYGHNNLNRLSALQVQSVLAGTNQAVKNQDGPDIRIMRPPGGNYNPNVCQAAGMPVVLWSVDTLDWRTRNTAATIQCIQKNARDGDIVLMHDLHLPTAKAADAVIRYLKAAGYQLVTVSELAAYRGGMAAGRVYTRF